MGGAFHVSGAFCGESLPCEGSLPWEEVGRAFRGGNLPCGGSLPWGRAKAMLSSALAADWKFFGLVNGITPPL